LFFILRCETITKYGQKEFFTKKTQQYEEKYMRTRSLGHYVPLLLAPAEGFGALQALLEPSAPS